MIIDDDELDKYPYKLEFSKKWYISAIVAMAVSGIVFWIIQIATIVCNIVNAIDR